MYNFITNLAPVIFGNFWKIFFITLIVNLTLGGFATEYVVEYWAPHVKGEPVDLPFFPHAFIGGIFLGEMTIPLAVITFIISGVM
jgi:hypothetical protein